MTIGKPIRIIGAAMLTGMGSAVLFVFTRKLWVPLLFIPLYFIVDGLISSFDMWLRRVTKDQLWLWGHEGREWLKTPAGEAWRQRTGYKR